MVLLPFYPFEISRPCRGDVAIGFTIRKKLESVPSGPFTFFLSRGLSLLSLHYHFCSGWLSPISFDYYCRPFPEFLDGLGRPDSLKSFEEHTEKQFWRSL